MNIQQLEVLCPSAFATKPHPHVSSNYVFIPSEPVIRHLYSSGFEATSVRFKRGESSNRFGSHCIRFQQPNVSPVVGDCLPQLVLFNSHDRSRRFALSAGLFRLACSNGLTVPHWSGNETAIRTKHIGCIDIQARIDSAITMLPHITNTVTSMMERQLTKPEVAKLVLEGIAAREGGNIPVTSLDFNTWLTPRRDADIGDSLWLTMNRLQENLIHGVAQRSRGMTCPNRIERVNTTLWNTACNLLS